MPTAERAHAIAKDIPDQWEYCSPAIRPTAELTEEQGMVLSMPAHGRASVVYPPFRGTTTYCLPSCR